MKSTQPGARWRIAAVVVLVAGLLTAGGVWVTRDDESTLAGTTYRIVGGRVDAAADAVARDRQIERMGGQALVHIAAFNRWLGSLWHGRRLAVTITVLAIAVAAGCAWIASLMDTPVGD